MKRRLLLVVLAVGIIALAVPVQATKITFDLKTQFSGGPPPTPNGLPWLQATFDDEGESGSVKLTMKVQNIPGDGFALGWYFNFNPDKT